MDLESALSQLPDGLRFEMLDEFCKLEISYLTSDWEAALSSSGKICECAFSVANAICRNEAFPDAAEKPRNLLEACRRLESLDSSVDRAARITMPRVISALYEIRNNRGGGHAGAPKDTLFEDASFSRMGCRWLLSNTVRMLNSDSEAAANSLARLIGDGSFPIVWTNGKTKRIAIPKLSRKNQVLLLLMESGNSAKEEDLCAWLEQKNSSAFRRDVLRQLHKEKMIVYDEKKKMAYLMPLGALSAKELLGDRSTIN